MRDKYTRDAPLLSGALLLTSSSICQPHSGVYHHQTMTSIIYMYIIAWSLVHKKNSALIFFLHSFSQFVDQVLSER